MHKGPNSTPPTNRDLTDYMKGVAISTVLAGHFASRFMSLPFDFHANYFIAFFFILSGYGIYFSSKTMRQEFTPRTVTSFLWKRCKRIYPLYWAYIIIDCIVDPNASIYDHSIYDIFLLQFHNPHTAWFLHAIVACYLFAPIAAWLMQKTERLFPIVLITTTIALNIVFRLLDVPPMRCWMYQFIYLGQFLLFGLGMQLAKSQHRFTFQSNRTIVAFLIVILITLCSHIRELQTMATSLSRIQILPENWHSLYPVAFYLLICSITLLFLRLQKKPPLFSLFKKLGIASYALYIFEGMFGTGLEKIGLISGHANSNGLIYIIVFPAFLFFCFAIQNCFSPPFFRDILLTKKVTK